MRKISDREIAITNRFFEALDILKARRVIHGYQDFIERYGLNQPNFSVLNKNREIRGVKTVYLAYLVEDYGVSAEWLLLGRGEMFTQTPSRT